MATPHVAGIAALIKQYNPSWTPSTIASAISTTSSKYDNLGEPMMAEGYETNILHPSTPFEYGAGIVNPNRAIDPGLVLPSGMSLSITSRVAEPENSMLVYQLVIFIYFFAQSNINKYSFICLKTEHEDFISFLCSLPNIDEGEVFAATGENCTNPFDYPSYLNLPSVTISALRGSVTVRRTVMNVGNSTETYLASVLPPNGTNVNLYPTWFTISPQGRQDLEIQLSVIQSMENFSFGEIVLTGSLDHIVRMTLSVVPVSV